MVEMTTKKKVLIAHLVVSCAAIGLIDGLTVHFTNESESESSLLKAVPSNTSKTDEGAVLMPAFSVDCLPDFLKKKTRDECAKRGCLWKSSVKDLAEPRCVYPSEYGYKLVGEPDVTGNTYRFNLQRVESPALYGDRSPNWQNVVLDVQLQTDSRLRIKFTPENETKWEVPSDFLNIEETNDTSASFKTSSFRITYVTEPTFGIVVTRKSTNATIFNSATPGLVLSDQFLQLTTMLPSDKLYGFGEHRHQTFKHDMNWKTWAIFTRDNGPNNDFNMYGQHPVYMNLEESGKANMVLLKSSNAMEVSLQPAPTPAVTYRTIGGVLDFYVYVADSPKEVVSKYIMSLGKPVFPPYWSLGFHLSRWGYKDINDMKGVIERNTKAGIPYESQWADIDTFHKKYVFTYDKEDWAGFPDLVKKLNSEKKYFVTIVDPGIGCDQTIMAEVDKLFNGWRAWVDKGTYVKNSSDMPLIGEVWPGITYFPDYSDPKSQEWWTHGIRFYLEKVGVKVSALWIDMNEPANFVRGSVTGCDKNDLNYPPFVPNILGGGDGYMFDKTLCMDAKHHLGPHYNLHSLYAHTMAMRTFRAQEEIFKDKRPWAMTRASFVGTGRYATKWQGDNQATWENMRNSIVHLIEIGMLGFPMSGSDICGFWFEPTTEMCIRWHQVGAFYPFSRNHNGKGDDPQLFKHQDPAQFGQRLIDIVKPVMMARQKLLPYFYTLLYRAHIQGDLVIRSLMAEFPEDSSTHDVKEQFLVGPALLTTPVLYENTTSVSGYFPKGRWFSYQTGEEIHSDGSYVSLPTPLHHFNLHIRGGFILPWQPPKTTTHESRTGELGLLIALDESGTASGELFWDDGVSTVKESNYYIAQFSMPKAGELKISTEGTSPSLPGLRYLEIYGLNRLITDVLVDGNSQTKKVEYFNEIVFVNFDGVIDLKTEKTITWTTSY